MLGEPVPEKLPPTTRGVLAFRAMAAASMAVVLEPDTWRWESGYLDTSSFGGGPKSEWFKRFPAAGEAARGMQAGPRELEASYRFWFWVRGGKPLACVSVEAIAYDEAGGSVDLMKFYWRRRKLVDVVNGGLGLALPYVRSVSLATISELVK